MNEIRKKNSRFLTQKLNDNKRVNISEEVDQKALIFLSGRFLDRLKTRRTNKAGIKSTMIHVAKFISWAKNSLDISSETSIPDIIESISVKHPTTFNAYFLWLKENDFKPCKISSMQHILICI